MAQKIVNADLGRINVEGYKNKTKQTITVVLDNVRSFNNVGSVFRTSDALCVEKIMLCGITPKPPHREIRKTALGATESVDWQYFNETQQAIKQLKKNGYLVYAIEQAKPNIWLQNFKPSKQPIALVFGHEVKGVEKAIIDMCDGVIEIPQFGTKHSFNIAVSFGIVLWDISCKFQQLDFEQENRI